MAKRKSRPQNCLLYFTAGGEEIRSGKKIRFPQGSEGSSPSLGNQLN